MNIDKEKGKLDKYTKDDLIAQIINQRLNDFVARYADNDEGKFIPYIGWYWRDVSFVEGYITIGNCGEFIGFIENNKWGYAQRMLSPDETEQVVNIICKAHDESRKGGILADIERKTKKQLAKLWPLMQTFTIATTGYYIYGPQGQVGYTETAEEADSTIVMLQEAAPGWRYWKVNCDDN